MLNFLKLIKDKVLAAWRTSEEVARAKAVETIEQETEEMENIFGVLVLGAFIGFPSPPMQISLDLMPDMEQEMILMLEKVDTAHDPLGQLFSVFGID